MLQYEMILEYGGVQPQYVISERNKEETPRKKFLWSKVNLCKYSEQIQDILDFQSSIHTFVIQKFLFVPSSHK